MIHLRWSTLIQIPLIFIPPKFLRLYNSYPFSSQKVVHYILTWFHPHRSILNWNCNVVRLPVKDHQHLLISYTLAVFYLQPKISTSITAVYYAMTTSHSQLQLEVVFSPSIQPYHFQYYRILQYQMSAVRLHTRISLIIAIIYLPTRLFG